MSIENLTNQLGALAVALADEQNRIVTEVAGANVNASALVVVLGLYPGETISDASQVLNLSHSATVRLVEHLVGKGLVDRLPGKDRREVQLQLTRKGVAVRQRILDARAALLARAFTRLAPDEIAIAEGLVGRMLAAVTGDEMHGDQICRFCDEDACGACPVEAELGSVANATSALRS